MRNASREFEFRLDTGSGVPVYRQLVDQVRGAVASGRLRAGDQLPTIRGVAVELAINPNTVARAYRDLEQCGAVETQHGTGCFIAGQAAGLSGAAAEKRLGRLAVEIAARAGSEGFTVAQLIAELKKLAGR